jgi:hypothetical protein
MTHESQTGDFGTGEWLIGAVKKNQEGMLLLAAGCAMLLRGAGQLRIGYANPARDRGDWRPSSRQESGVMSRGVDSARQYASDFRDNVSESAGSYASTARSYADDATRTVRQQSERLADQAQSTIDRVVQRQPLAVALAGLAAGAAVAAVFPATAIERRTLGPAGERLSEAAASASEKVNEAATAAGEKLKSAADEHGLNAEGLKEVARDVAGTIGETFTSEKNNQGGSSGGLAAGSAREGGPASSGATLRSAETSQSARGGQDRSSRTREWEGS